MGHGSIPGLNWFLWPVEVGSVLIAQVNSSSSALGTGATVIGGTAGVALLVNAAQPLVKAWIDNRKEIRLKEIEAEKLRLDSQRAQYERDVASTMRDMREYLIELGRWSSRFHWSVKEILSRPSSERNAGLLPEPPPFSDGEGSDDVLPKLPESVMKKSDEPIPRQEDANPEG